MGLGASTRLRTAQWIYSSCSYIRLYQLVTKPVLLHCLHQDGLCEGRLSSARNTSSDQLKANMDTDRVEAEIWGLIFKSSAILQAIPSRWLHGIWVRLRNGLLSTRLANLTQRHLILRQPKVRRKRMRCLKRAGSF